MNVCAISPLQKPPKQEAAKRNSTPRRFLTKTEAEELLDWYEAHGVHGLQLGLDLEKGFFVKPQWS